MWFAAQIPLLRLFPIFAKRPNTGGGGLSVNANANAGRAASLPSTAENLDNGCDNLDNTCENLDNLSVEDLAEVLDPVVNDPSAQALLDRVVRVHRSMEPRGATPSK